MRFGILGIVFTCLALVAIEVALHWYAGTSGSTAARQLKDAYLHKDPDNGKAYIAGMIDLVVPAIIVGAALGAWGATWPPRRLMFGAILVALGVVALFPMYARFFPTGGARWWLRTEMSPTTGDFVVAYLKALALCGVFVYGARILVQHFQHSNAWDRKRGRH